MRSPHPNRAVALAIALAVALLALPITAVAQDGSRIDLPAGWQPEGITTDGTYLYAGSLADGAIFRAEPGSMQGEVFIEGQEGEVAVGMDVGPGGDQLWVAGGDTGEVRVYDIATGALIQSYDVEAGFLNDLTATDEAVYVTDSFMPQLIVIPTGAAVAAPDQVTTIPLTGELEYQEGFNLNGIESTEQGLVAIHSPTGMLYQIDPETGETSLVETGAAELTAGDGLELVDATLFAVRNQLGLVAVLELSPDLASAELIGELMPEDVDVPTTAAYLDGALWLVNARFGTEPTPETEYWITRVDPSPVVDIGTAPLASPASPMPIAPATIEAISPATTESPTSPEAMATAAASPMTSPVSSEAEPGTTPAASPEDPEAAVQALLDALSAGRYEAVAGLFCEQYASQAEMLDLSGLTEGLPPGVDPETVTQAIRIVPDVQALETISRNEDEASVRFAGSLSIEVDTEALEPLITALVELTGQEVTPEMVDALGSMLASQFETQAFEIDEEVRVVQEDGAWRICDAFQGGTDPGSALASPE